ncbi:MAG: valyl-tRNA synthetase [Chthoniobacter sp.]|jgi:valyl-tRNA synthetase|nr:valyl-tRNA synthetase [Chthoniobacter sp.]
MPEIEKTYEPAAVEPKWYEFWLQNGCFTADPARVSKQRPAYSIVIPPPNVTGVLTLGHVLNNTIQDILARRARMLGKEVLWLPGTDHAGIATQNVVEKTLRKEGVMKHRNDLGREALVAKIWEWREKYGGIILQQLRALGCSLDWSRTRFTMDEHYSHCVSRVFVDLYKKGLIYRGKRMVNWCPASLTALSDEEVVMKEQNGVLYYFKVEVVEEPGRFLTIATTRPETIPGDSAIAVNPNDPRYAGLIGKHARRPLPRENQAPLPIIGDDAVAFDFGTGVLKVTPAHDKADNEIGQRHNLPQIDIIHPNGVMNDLAGVDLAGLERFAARKRAVEVLTELGALEKEEPYKNSVGYSERADVPIEPRLSEQWFLKYPSVAEARACVAGVSGKVGVPPAGAGVSPDRNSGEASDAPAPGASNPQVREGETPSPAGGTPTLPEMRFFPDRWAKVYDHWMTGIQDWCISRQLWWGHRIPVWTMLWEGPLATSDSDSQIVRFDLPFLSEEQNRKIAVQVIRPGGAGGEIYFGIAVYPGNPEIEQLLEQRGAKQDPDVLDTWFSSWLWPFATMGWPEKTETLAKFYPTTDLVTGPDIIFFWVARMIMAGFEWMGEMPFRNVYFTGIIRDKQGRKMSKSLGNSPDPLDLIAKFGADALRFGVMRSAPLGADILFDEKNVELGRNFCTKLWNAARFRQMQSGAGVPPTGSGAGVPPVGSEAGVPPAQFEAEIDPALLTNDDQWILLRLDAAIREVSTVLDEYRFSDAAQALYRFFWSEYCDWYLEASKAVLVAPASPAATEAAPPADTRRNNTLAVMDFVLAHTLRLFHPFLPFITEELWQGMGFAQDLPANQGGKTIMFAPWPKPFTEDERAYFGLDESVERFAAAKFEVVNQGRALRRDGNIASNKRVRFILRPSTPLPAHEVAVLKLLLNADPLDLVEASWIPPRGTPAALTPLGDLFLPLEGLIDVAAERERLTKEIAKVTDELTKVRAKLANPNFTDKVPAAVLTEHRNREAAWADKLAQLQRMLDALGL